MLFQFPSCAVFHELANQTAPRSSLIAIAKPYIDELSSSLGESVHLVVRDENDVALLKTKNTVEELLIIE